MFLTNLKGENLRLRKVMVDDIYSLIDEPTLSDGNSFEDLLKQEGVLYWSVEDLYNNNFLGIIGIVINTHPKRIFFKFLQTEPRPYYPIQETIELIIKLLDHRKSKGNYLLETRNQTNRLRRTFIEGGLVEINQGSWLLKI